MPAARRREGWVSVQLEDRRIQKEASDIDDGLHSRLKLDKTRQEHMVMGCVIHKLPSTFRNIFNLGQIYSWSQKHKKWEWIKCLLIHNKTT